jgi:large subunit GTPase 1
VNTEAFINNFLQGTPESKYANVARGGVYQTLRIPRRPTWEKGMTGKEIAHNENVAFLEWRRDIARQEEGNVNLAITPFEKNIEVWR